MNRATLTGLGATVVGALLLALGVFTDPQRAAHAYLAAFTWGATTVLGATVLLMVSLVAPIGWFSALRRPVSAIASTTPLLALLFVPVALSFRHLYPWAHPLPPDLPHHLEELLAHKDPWLRPSRWMFRSAVYLLTWAGLGVALRALALQDTDRSVRQLRTVSAGGLVLVAVTWTGAAVDWWMTLEPPWNSSILGFLTFGGGFLSGLCVAVLSALALERTRVLPRLPDDVYHAFGRLMLAFTVFWGYVTWCQLMLVWIADEPVEVAHYLVRVDGGYGPWAWVLGLGHFALPLLALLPRAPKRDRRYVAAVAAWLLLMHGVDMGWQVLPAMDGVRAGPTWIDLAAWLFVAGALLTAVATRIGAPVPAPLVRRTLEYRSR